MKTYLIGKPVLMTEEFGQFVKDEGLSLGNTYMVDPRSDGERLVEIGGRLCYMSFGKGRTTTDAFITNILAQKHFSVIEHANYTFIITGVSRSFTHELVRHRHFSYSQFSQRYVDQSSMEHVVPDGIKIAGLEKMWWEAIAATQKFYHHAHDLLSKDGLTTAERKHIHTSIRSVLPNAIETKIMVTGNARTWREFIQKRNIEGADPEIRAVAQEILEKLREVAPLFFTDLD